MIRLLLAYFRLATLRSDIARPYPPGQEPAKGGQTGGLPYPAGQERASLVNQHAGHDYKDDRTK